MAPGWLAGMATGASAFDMVEDAFLFGDWELNVEITFLCALFNVFGMEMGLV
jgi:hypothetical protein